MNTNCSVNVDINAVAVSGYGFVDFDSPQAADKAVIALQAQGVQAQMAKVHVRSPPLRSVVYQLTVCVCVFCTLQLCMSTL